MIDGLPITGLSDVGVVALIFLFGIGLATGRIWTRAQVGRLEKAHEREIERMEKAHVRELDDANHERGEWRTEARLKDQTIAEQSSQITAMAAGFEVLKDFLVALRRAGLRISQEEEPS